MSKPRAIIDYYKLDLETQEQIKLNYPHGFDKYLILFKNHKGAFISALPFETEHKYYLVKMSQEIARAIIEDDDDYKEGSLKASVKASLTLKHDNDDEDDDLIDDDILDTEEIELNEELDD